MSKHLSTSVRVPIESDNPSIVRNESLCIKCGQCRNVCTSPVGVLGTYALEQTIRAIPKEQGVKIWRPTVPIGAQDNMPLYWHEGTYSAHTGGWHCDAVMLVEYDD